MDINGIRFVMIIFGSAVRLKEIVDIEIKAEPDVAVEGCVAGQNAVGVQGFKVIAGVERVDPRLHRKEAIFPTAIKVLSIAHRCHYLRGEGEEFGITGVFVAKAKNLHAKEGGIEYGVIAGDRGVGEEETTVTGSAVEVVDDESGGRQSVIQKLSVARYLVGVKEGRGTEGCHHDRWCKPWEEESPARLPVEVVAPAGAVVGSFRAQREQQTGQAAYF